MPAEPAAIAADGSDGAGNDSGNGADSAEVFLDLVALLGDCRRRWLLLLAAAGAGLLLAFLYLNLVTPRYGASLRLTPAAATPGGSSLSGTLGRLGGLASLAGVRAPQGMEVATPFELYLDHLVSYDLAGQLVQDPDLVRHAFDREWDARSGTFHERRRLLRPLEKLLYLLGGQQPPAWRPPDAGRMQEYLLKHLDVVEPGTKDPPITTLMVRVKDPAYGLRLLSELHRRADADIRARELARSTEYARHLERKLAETPVVEHRISLSQALLEQQQSIMMATSSAAFAADPVGSVAVSPEPVSPRVLPSLAAGLLLGLFAGILAVVAGHVRARIGR